VIFFQILHLKKETMQTTQEKESSLTVFVLWSPHLPRKTSF